MSGARGAARLGVGVVGAGRVGAVLGSALRAVGHAVVGASGVSAESRERIDALLPGVPVLDVPEVVRRAELVLLTVPDDELAGVVEGLARLGAWQSGQLAVHTSGRYGVRVLEPARAGGAIPLAVHPAMTFTGTSLDLARLEGATFAVTAAAPVLPIAQALVVELGGEPAVVAEDDRALYHAALAHGSNHLVTLVAQAAQALAAAGLEHPGRALGPLLGAALDGALRWADVGPEPGDPAAGPGTPARGASAVGALTGPVVRGDVGTVRAHLDALRGLGADPAAHDVVPTYTALVRATAARAVAAGRLPAARAAEVLDALDDAGKPDPEQDET
ncbi:Rossmann-like and DUF2520 domain-containing protein [Luteimicrobium subarcticum]|uniref:Putative short-subunit dehydrogenase-like oxidoreductase (DUF2520 family) n=1 Tax=Luteimicrobium subarcticum TaxID=620910 RepID=A0A2M8WSL8_9MICO|nr:DUF2520 domain-containing protein [Luteimicrobium subarcticum]PJI93947.1 putative short-subunit dehydrogenase-like oxidoreductase (DUF2520 family) [Luteimicrobium subarcticum]